MSFTFENQGANTYLVYEIKPEDSIDTMSLGMLTNNRIPGLAQTLFMQMDTTKYIKYNVSAKVSVRQFFTGAVNKMRLLGVFNGIVDGLLAAEDYMIDSNMILLDLDYIFADVSTCNASLICLPIQTGDVRQNDLGSFFKNIMFTTQFDQTENCDHVAKIINFLNSAPAFSLDNFKKLLEEIGGRVSDLTQKEISSQSQSQSSGSFTQFRGQSEPMQVSFRQGANSIADEARTSSPVQEGARQSFQQSSMPQSGQSRNALDSPKPMENGTSQPWHSQSVGNGAFQSQAGQFQTPPVSQVQNGQPGAAPVSRAQSGKVAAGGTSQSQSSGGGKKMSMLNLMMHYSKENAELYKAQKAAKKGQPVQTKVPAQNTGTMPGGVSEQKPKGKQKGKAKNVQKPAGFAIPGAPADNAGFAIPGQPAPAQQPAMQQKVGQAGAVQQQSGVYPPIQQQTGRQANQPMAGQPGRGMQPAGQPGQYQQQTDQARAHQSMPGQDSQTIAYQSMPYQPRQSAQYQAMPTQAGQTAAYQAALSQPGNSVSFGETTVLGGGAPGETTVLGQSAQQEQVLIPQLIRKKTGEQILLNKPVYRIGKERSYVDYFIGDNTAISRSHANFITRDGEYFVVDTNSTNHTFVNGVMIQSNAEIKLSHGDRIRLANEDFEFRLY